MTFRFFPHFLFVILLMLPLFSCGDTGRGASAPPRIGDAAPEFSLADLAGKEVSLTGYRGRVVLLEFWATWCPPCRATIPDLVDLQEKYGPKGFTVLAVSLDRKDRGTDMLSAFAASYHINYPVLVGDERISHAYRVRSIPVSFLIDREGRILHSAMGFTKEFEAKMSSEIERVI